MPGGGEQLKRSTLASPVQRSHLRVARELRQNRFDANSPQLDWTLRRASCRWLASTIPSRKSACSPCIRAAHQGARYYRSFHVDRGVPPSPLDEIRLTLLSYNLPYTAPHQAGRASLTIFDLKHLTSCPRSSPASPTTSLPALSRSGYPPGCHCGPYEVADPPDVCSIGGFIGDATHRAVARVT